MSFPEIRLSSEQLRVLAHPLRSRLLTALRLDGPATATRLAASLGTNTGATSYHLRQLAAVGLVVEEERPKALAGADSDNLPPAPEHNLRRRGAGRQRWWRAAQHSHGWLDKDVRDDPDDQAAADWLSGHYLRWFTEMAQRWLAERREWPALWREAGFSSDFLLQLTPQRLGELKEELKAVALRYAEEPAQEGSEPVIVALYGFPRKRDES